MPAKSKAQRRFMGAELQRRREGKGTKTGMSTKQLKEYASGSEEGMPDKVKKKGKKK